MSAIETIIFTILLIVVAYVILAPWLSIIDISKEIKNVAEEIKTLNIEVSGLRKDIVANLPSVKPDHIGEVTEKVCTDAEDAVSRQAIKYMLAYYLNDKEKYLDAINDLKKLPSVKPDFHHWIPCNERLPDEHAWYLCSIKDNRVNAFYWNGTSWVDNVRKNMFDLYDIRSKLTGNEITPGQEAVFWDGWVIAWQPLPKPYVAR